MAPSRPPPKDTPKERNRKLPISAPTMPTTMSPMTPKPPPFMIYPASHPATSPIKINQINSMISPSCKILVYTDCSWKYRGYTFDIVVPRFYAGNWQNFYRCTRRCFSSPVIQALRNKESRVSFSASAPLCRTRYYYLISMRW
jgi:hypothetical protein